MCQNVTILKWTSLNPMFLCDQVTCSAFACVISDFQQEEMYTLMGEYKRTWHLHMKEILLSCYLMHNRKSIGSIQKHGARLKDVLDVTGPEIQSETSDRLNDGEGYQKSGGHWV